MNKGSMRKAHNYLFQAKGNDYLPQELDLLNNYLKFSKQPKGKSKKIALLMVSVNFQYWPYTSQVFEDVQKYFLPGHKTDVFLWSDMPNITEEQFDQKEKDLKRIEQEPVISADMRGQLIFAAMKECAEATYLFTQADQQKLELLANKFGMTAQFQPIDSVNSNLILNNIDDSTIPKIISETREALRKQKNLQENVNKFEVEPIEWPYGTIMRYSMFLQQEERLKGYDYIFYLDVDMRVVNVVGDEILGEGLTIAPHPGYYLRKELYPPYEPNDESASYIKRPGKVVMIDGQKRFMPFYAAGGFQGGTAKTYLKAMRDTKKLIDKDLNINNYIPIWNDETAWNKYVFDCQTKEEIEQTIFLTPSYIYPDSLIKEYYEKFWGRSFPPKIITLTKPFTTQKIDMSKFASM